MGQIWQAVDIADVVRTYRITAFVETGTGLGDSALTFATTSPHVTVLTIELIPEIYEKANARLSIYPNVHTFLGESLKLLPDLLNVVGSEGNCLFWLDAHFPGADFGLASYSDCEDDKVRIPLQEELETIVSNRNVARDVFVLDDLRIYLDGDFEDGNWVERHLYGGDGIDFVYELLGDTHNIELSYSQQGYIIATPK